MAGSIILNPPAEPSMSWETNTFAPRESVMVFRVHAQQRMRIAGTIALKPSGRDSMHCLKVITLRQR